MNAFLDMLSRPKPASIALVIGGGAWGVYWVPIRALEMRGLDGAWPGFLIYAVTLVALLPIPIFHGRRMFRSWQTVLGCGLVTGCAFCFYGISLALTDVIRAVLLFYLTPIWSTVLGYLFLGEAITRARMTALALGGAGLLAIVGLSPLSGQFNLGDAMALASGMLWSVGTLFMFRSPGIAIPDQIFSFVFGAFVVTGGVILFGGPALSGLETPDLAPALPYTAMTVLWVLPMLFLTLWPTTVLTPTRVGLLLMSEIVVGVITAALWAGEPFGVREVIGSALIVSAGLVEVIGHRPEPAL